MEYGLGVDLGTTYTAAAVRVAGRLEIVQLGTRRPEIPSVVFVVVFLFLVSTTGILGYLLVGRRGRAVLGLMVVLLTLVQLMILDVDRPRDGGIREDQLPIELLKASLESLPPGAYDQFILEDAKAEAARKSGRSR